MDTRTFFAVYLFKMLIGNKKASLFTSVFPFLVSYVCLCFCANISWSNVEVTLYIVLWKMKHFCCYSIINGMTMNRFFFHIYIFNLQNKIARSGRVEWTCSCFVHSGRHLVSLLIILNCSAITSFIKGETSLTLCIRFGLQISGVRMF